MTIASFDDLLRSAREQSEPQRLLFVFTSAGVPDNAMPEQRALRGRPGRHADAADMR